MRVVTMNTRNRTAKRSGEIVSYLVGLDPTVVVLTEVKWNSQAEAFCGRLSGYNVEVSNCDGGYAVVIASKTPLRVRHVVPRLLEAELVGLDVSILGVYVPAPNNSTHIRKIREVERRDFWQALFERAATLEASPALIAGDLNSCLPEDSHNYTAYSPDCIRALRQRGWRDAWLEFHESGDTNKYTFFSSKGGFRLDYLFLSAPLVQSVREAVVSHDQNARTLCDLDHASVVLEMPLDATASVPRRPNSAWSRPA